MLEKEKDELLLPKFPEKLKEAAEKGELVLFLGAGVSMDFGCSSWNNLAQNLLNKCYENKIIDFSEKTHFSRESNSKKIITICQSLLEKNELKEIFEEEMKRSLNDEKIGIDKNKDNKKYKANFEMFKNLLKLGGIVVTTNADKHADHFFSSIEYNIFSTNTEIKSSNLYKIHGSVENVESLVFNTGQYLTRYNSTKFIDFIKKIFGSYTIIFIGYSLQELELLDHLITKTGGGRKDHYLLKEFFKAQNKIIKIEQHYFDQLKVKLIPYYLDENGYDELKNVIKKWSEEVQNETIVPIKQLKEIDDIMENPHD